MDRRSQRWLLVLLFFGVSIFIYRSLGGERLKRVAGLGVTKTSVQNADAHGLNLRGLEPANGTLGVSTHKHLVFVGISQAKVELHSLEP